MLIVTRFIFLLFVYCNLFFLLGCHLAMQKCKFSSNFPDVYKRKLMNEE